MTALVRRHDPDRFLTALFAPSDRRDALMALYAFNHELARAREVASQPMLAFMRLQWWREVVEGEEKRHEVATPLRQAIAGGLLRAEDLLPIIEAREIEAEEDRIETLDGWRSWLWQGAGGLSVAAARLLGAPDAETFRPYGAAYGGAGLLRTVPSLARQGRCLLPIEVLAREGLSPEIAIAAPDSAPLGRILRELAAEVVGWLQNAPSRVRARSAVAAALPAVLARRDLARVPAPWQPRGLGARAAVVWAAVSGRI